jgi:hypothetical protein
MRRISGGHEMLFIRGSRKRTMGTAFFYRAYSPRESPSNSKRGNMAVLFSIVVNKPDYQFSL